MRGQDFGLLSVDETLQALPVRKGKRWLLAFLRKHPTDPRGRPTYRSAGRDKLIYLAHLIEALPCPSESLPVATKGRRRSTSGAAISESRWTRAAELTGDPSLANCSSGSRVKSNGENIQHVNFRAATNRGRS
jgi:hypothetical protein